MIVFVFFSYQSDPPIEVEGGGNHRNNENDANVERDIENESDESEEAANSSDGEQVASSESNDADEGAEGLEE
jgi:hypothetical protein